MQGTNNKILRVLFVAAAVLTMGSCKESGGGGSGTDACGSDECKLTASDAVSGDVFGFATAIDGDELLIGAENHDVVGVGSGAVYAYRRVGSEYEEIQKIVPAGLAAGDAFGSAIAIDGDVAVIGARLAKGGNGSAYVFRLVDGQWVEEQELVGLFGEVGPEQGQFGRAVAISGPWIAVGAPRDNFFVFAPRPKMGSVSMFEYTNVPEQDPWEFPGFPDGYLTPERRPSGELFGTSVALDGNVLAVGAVGDSTVGSITITEGGDYRVGSTSFATVVLDCVGCDGTFLARHIVAPPRDVETGELLLDPDGQPARRGPMTGVIITSGGNGGSSLPSVEFPAVFGSGSGAIGTVNLDTSGAAFVYSLNEATGTWTPDQKLKAVREPLVCEAGAGVCSAGGLDDLPDPFCNDGYGGDHFGISVAVKGDRVVIGADGRDRQLARALGCGLISSATLRGNGGAYVYQETAPGNGDWVFEVLLEPADSNVKKAFGSSEAMDSGVLAVGARGDDDSGVFSGAAYFYRLVDDPEIPMSWQLDTKIRASDAASNDYFGESIAVEGERMSVGAWADDDAGPRSGSAYAFDL
ncbi:MAG: hypothetical protein H8E63_08525 [Proteobacteria bacterium]|nr:hypothetical protein [Pseudomonadota bacterium]